MTPLMKQYWEIKSLHQDQILLFRMGDFYEMFFEDAKIAAPLLGIALTSRNKKAQDETPMCGVPHHSIMGPLQKLLAAGLKVAICDQIEDPREAKGIVKRAVTRILTPGMILDAENNLAPQETRWIACFDSQVFAAVETSTGDAIYFDQINTDDQKSRLLSQMNIAELLLKVDEAVPAECRGVITRWDKVSELTEDPELTTTLPRAARRILSYLESLVVDQHSLPPLRPFERRRDRQHLGLPATTIRSLELFQTYLGEEKGSLIHAIDRTKSAAGARRLRDWLLFPLMDKDQILRRQDRVEFYRNEPEKMRSLREKFARVGDLERRLVKVASPSVNARDVLQLGASLSVIDELKEALELSEKERFQLQSLHQKISSTVREDAPLQLKSGGLIREGISKELDDLKKLTSGGENELFAIESREREVTGIPSLKIRYNQVFGFYIEVTNTHAAKVPTHYMRKQTLTNAERFTTVELTELEKKVLSSQTKRDELEYQIFLELRNGVLEQKSFLLTLAARVAETDATVALAWLALERSYSRPQLREPGGVLRLLSSRHPVVEQMNQDFVPNDIILDQGNCFLLTGPNMAGKSTLMRQVALSVILAQMGSFVPAGEAEIPLFNQILTRVEASDQLSLGLSTFMVEMQETAEILKNIDSHSLMIVDEIGRGTSTQDGLALAQAILEHLLDSQSGYLIFATHFHELTGLVGHRSNLKLGHMLIKEERGGGLRFLHTLCEGVATQSYGVHVAEQAGLPKKIIRRAERLLKQHSAPLQLDFMSQTLHAEQEDHSSINTREETFNHHEPIIEEIKSIDLQNTTPIEALIKLESLKKQITVSLHRQKPN